MNQLAVAAAALAVACCVDVQAQTADARQEISADAKLGLEGLGNLSDSAEQALANEDYETAARLFDAVLASARFAQLDRDRQRFILTSAAEVASMRSDFELAHQLYRRASAFPQADSDAWMGRLNSAWFVGRYDDAVDSLVTIARRWPDELEYISEWAIDALLAHTRKIRADVELPLLEALFDSGWQTDLGQEPSDLWLRLIELLAEQESIDRALDVSARLRDPLAIVTMLSDRRFARIVAAAPDWFASPWIPMRICWHRQSHWLKACCARGDPRTPCWSSTHIWRVQH